MVASNARMLFRLKYVVTGWRSCESEGGKYVAGIERTGLI
jgi:hypothetical protein